MGIRGSGQCDQDAVTFPRIFPQYHFFLREAKESAIHLHMCMCVYIYAVFDARVKVCLIFDEGMIGYWRLHVWSRFLATRPNTREFQSCVSYNQGCACGGVRCQMGFPQKSGLRI